MSVREYIGARYVPRFLGTYDPTQLYQALDVVDNGAGTSYIARKTTPPGTPLTDSDFWFVYGASSGAIYDLQTRMGAAENDIDDLETGYAYLDVNRVMEMKDRVFLFIADSYQVLTDYCTTIAGWIGCKDFFIRAKSGAGFFREPGSGMPYETYWYENILENLDPLSDAEKAVITDVCILPTANDNQTNDSDLSDAMISLNTWFRSNLPKLRHVHVRSCGWGNGTDAYLVSQLRVTNCLNIYSNMCPRLSWEYVDCTRVMKTCNYFDSSFDGRHPTNDGANIIARAIANSLFTGSCSWASKQMVFRFNMSLPAAWSAATIAEPSDGVLKIEAYMDASGVYYWRCNQEIRITGVPLDTSYSTETIALTPAVNFANPFPVYYRAALEPYTTLRDNAFNFAELARTSNANTGIVVGGSLPAAGTTALRIRFPGNNINYCNLTGV